MAFISNRIIKKTITITPALCLLICLNSAASQENSPEPKPGIPISFSADKVVTNLKEKTVILTGKAIILQQDKQISADKIVIDFTESPKTDGNTDEASQQQINKLTATGNVNIDMTGRKAVTEMAVYTASDKKIVLTGKDSTVTGPEGKLSCGKIIIDQSSSISECIGSGKSRASGLIFSDKSGF